MTFESSSYSLIQKIHSHCSHFLHYYNQTRLLIEILSSYLNQN